MAKRLQIGIGRDVVSQHATSDRLQWAAVGGGSAAQWTIRSRDAQALRIGLAIAALGPGAQIRFAGLAQPDVVYGPFTARDVAAASHAIYWSPVLEGDSAAVELFIPDSGDPSATVVAIAQLSHLFASPSQANVESLAKSVGDAGSCEVDLICRSATDAALAATGRAVARMSFNDGASSFFCTGTLLNPVGGTFIPYFYSANHCMDNESVPYKTPSQMQVVASTLTTQWFFDRTGCGTGGTSPSYVQLTGGATLLFNNQASDALLLRLNATPPNGAWFSGWDSTTVSNGTAFTAVHHPAADLKKVSLGSMGGFGSPTSGTASNFIISQWNSIATGVTEPGSSGSGIFTAVGSPASDYRLRGGLYAGPSSCSAGPTSLYDYYSRFDQVYPSIAQYLGSAQNNAGSPPQNYTALWWNAAESGWGVNFNQQGDILFGTLFTYDASGNPMWLVMSNGARQGGNDVFSGTLYRTTGPAFNASPFTPIGTPNLTQVGTMTANFTTDPAVLTYSVNGITVTKNITRQIFGSRAAQCSTTTGDRSALTNYQDLWWNQSESGWGINLTHQDNTLFATLFTYAANGQGTTNPGLWLVMSNGVKQSDGSYLGTLYQTVGPAFNAQPFTPVTNVTAVGTMRLQFSSGTSGTLSYTVNGTSVTKSIIRQVFSSPVPACS